MSFAGKVWRLLVGIKDGLALLFLLLFFFALFAVLTSRPNPGLVRDGALLLELDGIVVEEKSEIDPLTVLLSGTAPTGEFDVQELVHAIDEAATDKRIKAVVLDLTRFMGGGHVHMQDIGAALDRVRAADKPVLAYATAYTDDAMMLAAHSSEVWVDPLGGAIIAGPGGERMYYAGLLDKLIQARCAAVVANTEIAYVRELRPYQHFSIDTRILGWDDKYVYFDQRFLSQGKLHTHALLRVVHMYGGKAISPQAMQEITGLNMQSPALPEYVEQWKKLLLSKKRYTEQ